MKKNVLIALAISAMLFVSCKKDDSEEITLTEPAVKSTAQSPIPLKVGNQWVYNVYFVKYDTLGNAISERFEQIDTITVIRKEVIDNQEYFVVNGHITIGIPKKQDLVEEYLRLENGRLTGPKFKTEYSIHTSSEQLDSFVIDSVLKINYFVHSYDEIVSLPAGNFDNVIETVGETYYYNNLEKKYIRYKNNDTQSLYSPQIGLLSNKVYYASKTSGFRRELISYTLN